MATTPFIPRDPSDEILADSLENIPRYLFRVFDHNSPGTTNLTQVSSPVFDITLKPGKDLYQLRPQVAADILNAHLRWECQKYSCSIETPCNLMSWTSSLLSALQYTLYRHKTNHVSTTLSDICILVVDTHQFEKGTFVRDLQALEGFRAHAVSNSDFQRLCNWRVTGRFYSGEYLSQGKLTIDPARAHVTTIKDLISRGLFTICPALGERTFWSQWAKRVNSLREGLSPVDASDAQTVMNVAENFGTDFEIPVALMLLSMARGFESAAPKYMRALLERYPRDALREVESTWFSSNTHLEELERCQDLAALLADELGETDGQGVHEFEETGSQPLHELGPVESPTVQNIEQSGSQSAQAAGAQPDHAAPFSPTTGKTGREGSNPMAGKTELPTSIVEVKGSAVEEPEAPTSWMESLVQSMGGLTIRLCSWPAKEEKSGLP